MTHDEQRNRRKQIAAAVREGASIGDAAERFGVCFSVAAAACREFGVDAIGRRSAPQMPFRTMRVLADLLNEPATLETLAAKHGVSPQRIYQIAKDAIAAGIKLPARQEARAVSLFTCRTERSLRMDVLDHQASADHFTRWCATVRQIIEARGFAPPSDWELATQYGCGFRPAESVERILERRKS